MIGMFSYQDIIFLHSVHDDLGKAIFISRGNLYIKAFKKLPTSKPKILAKTVSVEININPGFCF